MKKQKLNQSKTDTCYHTTPQPYEDQHSYSTTNKKGDDCQRWSAILWISSGCEEGSCLQRVC